MRKDKLNDYVSGIDDAFISESASVRGGMKLRKAGIIVSAMKIAACLLLAVGISAAAILLPQMKKSETTPSESGKETGTVDNITERNIAFRLRALRLTPQDFNATGAFRFAKKELTDYQAVVIKNSAELDEYIEGYRKQYFSANSEPDERVLAELKARYTVTDSSFFEKHDLIILPVFDGTISTIFRVMSFTESENEITLNISYKCPEVFLDAEQTLCMAIETEEKLNSDKPVHVRFADNDTFTGGSETGMIFRIDTTTTSSYISPIKIIRSKQDAKNYLYRYVKNEENAKELKSCFDRYDEEFFRTNYLAVVSTMLGSSVYLPEIDAVIDSWNGLKVTIGYTAPEGDVTTDILPITAVIPIAGQIAENSACDLSILEK